MRNRGEAAPKFIGQQKKKKKAGPVLQICKGKSILETSNSHTDQMDADQVSSDGVAYVQMSSIVFGWT
ncbi:hypothetical protein P3S67_026956 [Capsicum chacoense]